jgi:hypothetical protein
MGLFNKLFGNLLAFVYHCFDRIVIHGYLSAPVAARAGGVLTSTSAMKLLAPW